jgi:hypothetical protein
MRIKYLAICLALVTFSCKEKASETTVQEIEEVEEITTSVYPESITKVFNAHGGIDTWNKMQTLAFTMNKANGAEVTTNNLKTRAELIDTPTHSVGFDGSTLWVNEKGDNEFKGKAKFYKGLMMYFYAMPFIVGDNGIIYEDVEPLVFEGKSYPGILISYEAGVGASPDDQYLVYYDAETSQMAWLGYTVTFGRDGRSEDFHYIRYNNWQTVNGLVLPQSMDWYAYENNLPTEKRNTVEFSNVVVSEDAPENTLFAMPETGRVIE